MGTECEQVVRWHKRLVGFARHKKSDLRASFSELVQEGFDLGEGIRSGSYEFAATSGTTGERVQIVSDLTVGSVPGRYDQFWNLPTADAEYVHKTAVFTGPVCLGTECSIGEKPYVERLRGEGSTLYLNSPTDLFSMSKVLASEILDDIARFQPDILLVNPIYLDWLLRQSEAWALQIPTNVSLVLSCYQLLPGIQRRNIESKLDCQIREYYFATDIGGCRMGAECHLGTHHVRDDHVHVDVVNAPEIRGNVGHALYTSLIDIPMQLVRYNVGDIISVEPSKCSCVYGYWDKITVHGRAKDCLWNGGEWITPRQFDDVVSTVDGIAFYSARESGGQLSVAIIPAANESVDEKALRDRLREVLSFSRTEVRLTDRLDPEASTKFRLTSTSSEQTPNLSSIVPVRANAQR